METDIMEELYRKYYPGALLYTLTLCGNQQLAEDITAEAFVKAYLSLPGEVPSFAFWLCRVCKNLWIDHLRKHKHLTDLDAAAYISDPITPETVCLQNEQRRFLWDAITALSPLDRELVTLHYFSGLSLREIAPLLGKSYPATRQRLHRLRQVLKQRMEEQGYE